MLKGYNYTDKPPNARESIFNSATSKCIVEQQLLSFLPPLPLLQIPLILLRHLPQLPLPHLVITLQTIILPPSVCFISLILLLMAAFLETSFLEVLPSSASRSRSFFLGSIFAFLNSS